MGISRVIFFLLIVLYSHSLLSQEGVSKDIRSLNGEKLYFHVVEKGNTIYGISKMYNVDIKEIYDNNPEAVNGLRIDQVLKIPVKRAKIHKIQDNKLKVEGSYLIHRVVKGETLYGISKRYNISQEQILKNNPIIRDGLNPGVELKIETLASKPKIENDKDKASSYIPAEADSFINHTVQPKETWYGIASRYQVNIDTLMIINSSFRKGIKVGDVLRIQRLSPKYLQKKEFNIEDTSSISLKDDTNQTRIMLFLPFYLDENDTSYFSKVEEGLTFKNEINPKSKLAFEFYEGVLLALDSLSRTNKEIVLSVFDTKSNSFSKILDSLDFSRVDLVVGPLFRSNFELVVKKAKPYGIPVISPVPQSNKILLDNPNVIKLAPSYASEVAFMRNYYDGKLKGSNFYLVNSSMFKDAALINVFLNEGEGGQEFDSSRIATLSNPEDAEIKSLLDTVGNYFFIPSTNKGYVGRFVNMLYPYSRKYPITIFGMSNWADYDHLDIDYLQALNFHYTTEFFVDYDDWDVINFLKKYRAAYGTEPKKYGYIGYEVIMNFVDFNSSNMMQDLERINASGMVVNFDFRKFDFSNGVENRGLFLIQSNNYRLERVK